MADALESFRISDTPVEPRPEFVRALRARLERSAAMTTTTAVELTPYICVHDADAAIRFYADAFGAVETYRLTGRDGRIGHAELDISGNRLMLADEYPEAGALGPRSIGGAAVLMHLSVPDVDAAVARAVEAGATLVRPVADEFYGDRVGRVLDPFGYAWHISTMVEQVSAEEAKRRWDAMEGEDGS